MMRRVNITLMFISGLVALVALGFTVTAFLPYGTLKPLADSLVRDGNLSSLKESNAIVFKILLGAAGLLLMGGAYIIGTDRLKDVSGHLSQYFSDFTNFLKALKPTRVYVISLTALILIVGLAVIFRWVRIYDRITHDEAYTFVVFSSTSIFNIVSNYHLPNNHVLSSLLIYFSTHLFGIRVWVVRLPSLLAGILLIPATYVLAKAIYDKYTALASALLIAILPGAILYSTVARGYSLVALLTVVTLWLANYLRGNKNWFAWSLLVLFSALGFYTVPVMLFPFGIVFGWLFFENLVAGGGVYGSKINFLKYWLVAGVATAVLVLILYTPIFIYTGFDKVFANQWVIPGDWNGFVQTLPSRLLDVWHEWTGGLSPIWIVLLLVGFVLSLLFHRRISRQRFPLQIAAFLWVTSLLLYQRPEGVAKIWAFLQAPFMIWSASGIMGLIKDIRVKFAWNMPLAAIVVSLPLIISGVNTIKLLPTLPDLQAQEGPAEKTVLAIKSQLDAHDLIIIDSPYDAPVWYYAKLYGLPDSLFDKKQSFDHLFVIVSPNDGQTLQSVLKTKGPDLALIDLEAFREGTSYGNLDTYIVPHR